MWILTIRSPMREPREHVVTVGKTTVGRKSDNDIVIADESASRWHAELSYDPNQDTVVLRDLGSKNGTFVNHERLTQPHTVRPGDQIRIGQHVIRVSVRDRATTADTPAAPETQPITPDLLLESVDQHAVLLYEVARRLNTLLDLDVALQEISKLTRVAMAAEKCELIPAERFGQLAELGFPTSIARQAIEQRSVVAIPDLAAQTDVAPGESAVLLRIRSVLCVPVMIGEEVLALTYVYKTDPASRPFDQHDVHLAVAISHQAALAIQRARLLEKARWLEQLAILDSLTGLHNRRHFFELAEREFQRARRFRRLLSAIMFDVDSFKHVNDVYGHAVGDQVLRAVAVRCRKTVRDLDLVARYGGDEFVVLILENDLEGTLSIAERFRRGMAETPVDTDRGPLSVTISLGIAPFTDDCPNLATLLNDADAALYAAKKAGRNRVDWMVR